VAVGKAQFFVAFDASSVCAAAVSAGLGRPRLLAFARSALAPGALVPSPSSRNLARAPEVAEAAARAFAALSRPGGGVVLVLPDGLARLALVSVPDGADPREMVRFRLASSLPWPASETLVESLAAGPGQVVGAAVRRGVIHEYEQAAAAAGLVSRRVHLAPLLALEAVLKVPRDGVHVLLGDAAVAIAVVHDGALRALHSRRRDPGSAEAERLAAEAARAAAAVAPGCRLPVLFSGAGAAVLSAGSDRDSEGAWLAGALA
jgi:Tfp pilus assembly PilM family ATPase